MKPHPHNDGSVGLKRHSAILLLGPTGAGKTPLGEVLEAHGFGAKACHHLDFGQQLRDLDRAAPAAGDLPGWPAADLATIRGLLHAGLLLEADTFYIAQRVVAQFLARKRVGPDDWIVLNGLPRHAQQADAVDGLFAIRYVVLLDCNDRVAGTRIRQDSGGDRAVRTDDDAAAVARKLAIFRDRTQPLVNHYQHRGAGIIPIPVAVQTQPLDMLAVLAAAAKPK